MICVYFEELVESLNRYTNSLNGEDIRLRLFNNDITPDSQTEIGEFDECTVPGYAYEPLTDWPTDGASYDHPRAVATHPWVTFTASDAGLESIYGWYVTRGSGELLFSFRFNAPLSWGISAGHPLTVQVTYTRRSEFHSDPPE